MKIYLVIIDLYLFLDISLIWLLNNQKKKGKDE